MKTCLCIGVVAIGIGAVIGAIFKGAIILGVIAITAGAAMLAMFRIKHWLTK